MIKKKIKKTEALNRPLADQGWPHAHELALHAIAPGPPTMKFSRSPAVMAR